MEKKSPWDFALRLSGIGPDSLSMLRLADYMQAWAALMGPETRAMFRGMVKGSALLRAHVPETECAEVEQRLRNAANDAAFAQLGPMLFADNIRQARFINKQGAVLALITPLAPDATSQLVLYDEVDIDGCVVRVEGKDKTSHIGLVESGTGRAISLQTSSTDLARDFARHYRNGWVRVRTEGTWLRHADGQWEPKSLLARSLTVLDDAPAQTLLQELAQIPGNGWATMTRENALARWRQLRGLKPEKHAEVLAR